MLRGIVWAVSSWAVILPFALLGQSHQNSPGRPFEVLLRKSPESLPQPIVFSSKDSFLLLSQFNSVSDTFQSRPAIQVVSGNLYSPWISLSKKVLKYHLTNFQFIADTLAYQEIVGEGKFLYFCNKDSIGFNYCYLLALKSDTILSKESIKFPPNKGENASPYIDAEPVPLNYLFLYRKIKYPPEALRKGLEAFIIIRVLVDSDGKALSHYRCGEGNESFYTAVEKYILELKFKPARIMKYYTKVWVSIPFDFKLE